MLVTVNWLEDQRGVHLNTTIWKQSQDILYLKLKKQRGTQAYNKNPVLSSYKRCYSYTLMISCVQLGTPLCAPTTSSRSSSYFQHTEPLSFSLFTYFFLTGNRQQHFSTVIFTYILFTGQVKSFSSPFFGGGLLTFFEILFIWEWKWAQVGERERDKQTPP